MPGLIFVPMFAYSLIEYATGIHPLNSPMLQSVGSRQIPLTWRLIDRLILQCNIHRFVPLFEDTWCRPNFGLHREVSC
jgi:hypothetical protein